MANLIRSAKSGSDWTKAELDAYNIQIIRQDAVTFFAAENLPNPCVDQEILDTVDARNMISDQNANLINLLDLAMVPSSEESAVDDFAVELFKRLGYAKRNRVARTRKDIRLVVCGENKDAQTDVCIIDRDQNDILLLVQEDKRYGGGMIVATEAEAQLIANAIGAFGHNNLCRENTNLPHLEIQMIPGIVMTGTIPTFYKILVTCNLEYAVRHGMFPPQQTKVFAHHPQLPRHRHLSEGMKPLDSRREILKCYEAFKAIIGL